MTGPLWILSGGFVLFLFGMDLANDGLERLAAHKLRILINWVTRSRILALLLGGVATFTLQSSSITSLLLINFVNSSLLRLDQALAMLLGANIGTTFTVQILATNVTELAFLLLMIGFLLKKGIRNEAVQNFGSGLMGFALLFYGMSLMSSAMGPLKNIEFVKHGIEWIKSSFFISLSASIVFTAIVHSSAVVIVLIMTLLQQGVINFHESIPMILGANIGTCSTAILASLGRGVNAWRLSLGNLSMKMAGVLILFPWIPWFEKIVIGVTRFQSPLDVSYRLVANAHTFFNLGISLLLLPGTAWAALMLNRLIPEKKEAIAFDVEREGLAAVEKGISHMADRIRDMLTVMMEVFEEGGLRKLRSVQDADEEIDLLNGYFLKYLARKTSFHSASGETRQEMRLLYGIDILEHIGDLISKDMCALARKKIYKDLEFSMEDQGKLEKFHGMVYNIFDQAIQAFLNQDAGKARGVVLNSGKTKEFKKEMYMDHLEEIQKGLKEAMASTAVYFDILTDLELISDYSESLAKTVLE